MNKAIAKKWADALRSGKYKQCRDNFYTTNEVGERITHCCLAVLSEITNCKDQKYPEMLAYPAEKGIIARLDENQFIVFNDDMGFSFEKIADEVERLYLKKDAVSN